MQYENRIRQKGVWAYLWRFGVLYLTLSAVGRVLAVHYVEAVSWQQAIASLTQPSYALTRLVMATLVGLVFCWASGERLARAQRARGIMSSPRDA